MRQAIFWNTSLVGMDSIFCSPKGKKQFLNNRDTEKNSIITTTFFGYIAKFIGRSSSADCSFFNDYDALLEVAPMICMDPNCLAIVKGFSNKLSLSLRRLSQRHPTSMMVNICRRTGDSNTGINGEPHRLNDSWPQHNFCLIVGKS